MAKTLYDILNKELKTEDVTITEEDILNETILFKISPFVAFTALKQNVLSKLSKSEAAKPFKAVGKAAKGRTAKALIADEKLKAKLGSKGGNNPNATYYSFTKEQRNFMAHIRNKYGKQIVREVEKFRENILAPYQIIKRQIKENKSLTAKEVNGMTHEEYLKYRESGRKKIERRATHSKDFSDRETELRLAKEGYESASKEYNDVKNGKKPDFSESKLEKAFELMGYGTSELQGYPKDEFRRSYNRIKEYERLLQYNIKNNDDPTEIVDAKGKKVDLVQDMLGKMKDVGEVGITRAEIGSPREKTKEGENVTRGSFRRGYIVYLLRKEIREKFESDFGSSNYKRFYIQVLEQLVKEAKEKRNEMLQGLVKSRKDIELNSMEKKIWAPLPTTMVKYSSDIKDYYLKLKDDDFGPTKHYEVPESMRKAEDAVNREVKAFERNLKKIMEPEDLSELKRLRLINNLLTVKDLKTPDKMFKSKDEISKGSKTIEDNDSEMPEDESEEEKEFVSEEEYLRELKDYINMKFDSIKELEEAKKDIKELESKVDSKIAKKYKDLVNQFMRRRDIKPETVQGHKYDTEGEGLITSNEVQDEITKALEKDYNDINELKQKMMQLQNLINKFKEQEPDATRELQEIDFLYNKLSRKTQGGFNK